MSEVPNWYIKQKHFSSKLDLFRTPYDCGDGTFNPLIVEKFASKYLYKGDLVWEPFAGHIGPNRTIEICKSYDVDLIAYDINPCDNRVVKANSLKCNPKDIQGIIFHPPYIGASPMSNEEGELSLLNYDEYIDVMFKFIGNLKNIMSNGFACVVARSIVKDGKKIQLDWIFCDLFIYFGFEIVEIFNAIPDWVIILEKKI